jgi:hypothetical protein
MEFELTRSDYLIQDYIAKMGGATDAQLGAWLRPTEAERLNAYRWPTTPFVRQSE